ncbi:MAG: NifU family protein [Chitinophagales bacterium]|nr:NifU family protein [Chitinophagales bacterium]MDW8427848.1 NifU family protein [Chitinophagales bacterium]
MEKQAKRVVEVYTEMTPNPETMKFVADIPLFPGRSADFPDEESAKVSPLATELFGFPFVKSVFIMNNFVTVTKTPDANWLEISGSLRQFIKDFLEEGKTVIDPDYKPAEAHGADEDAVVAKIKEMLEQYVKPAVEMDGGAIEFKSYRDGRLELMLQGSCSGCPSSMITLKAGIEGLLKRMVPEVKEVVAESM